MTNSIEKVINLMGDGSTISSAIFRTYTTQKLRFKLDDKIYNTCIANSNLDKRIKDGLLRNKVTTFGEFIECITDRRALRGIGKVSLKRTFCKIVDMAWDNMTTIERAEFLLDIDANNTIRA